MSEKYSKNTSIIVSGWHLLHTPTATSAYPSPSLRPCAGRATVRSFRFIQVEEPTDPPAVNEGGKRKEIFNSDTSTEMKGVSAMRLVGCGVEKRAGWPGSSSNSKSSTPPSIRDARPSTHPTRSDKHRGVHVALHHLSFLSVCPVNSLCFQIITVTLQTLNSRIASYAVVENLPLGPCVRQCRLQFLYYVLPPGRCE
jgi:hypothetical protein